MSNSSIDRLIERQKELGGRKILQFGSLAGWPYTLAHTCRELGIGSENWWHFNSDVQDLNRQLPFDATIFNKDDKLTKKIGKRLRFIKECPEKFCLIHYHGGTLFSSEKHFLLEGPYFKRKNVPMVISLGGSEARLQAFSKKKNPYYYNTPNFRNDLRIKLRWLSWKSNIGICATDPEMAVIAEQYFENVALFRQPVILSKFPVAIPLSDNDTPLLLHVPTDTKVKGTEYILKAVENLKAKGLRFEFKMVRQLTQSEFYKCLASCDVYIDELRCGAHGVTAVESMAMGKPTISYIREDLIARYPENLPLVNANPDTIEAALERLIVEAGTRTQIGEASRRYVEQYHDAKVIVEEMAQVYLELLKE